MGFSLHETVMGQRFFGHDFPDLVRSLNNLHEGNKQLIELKQTEINLKRKEIALKERELLLRERELELLAK